MRTILLCFLAALIGGCSASPFIGRWTPDRSAAQPYLASTRGFELALNANGASTLRAVIVHNSATQPATQPATVVKEMEVHGSWKGTSSTTADLCLDSDHVIARLESGDKMSVSGPGAPIIMLQRDR
jgi:hypothetical protein